MAIPDEWVDRIFLRFEQIYGDRYKLKPDVLAIVKIMYKNALEGCSADEIRRGITHASKYKYMPPNIIEFWHWCKDIPYRRPKKPERRWTR